MDSSAEKSIFQVLWENLRYADFFEQLQDLRSEGHLIDVTLCAEGQEIPCHRLVLSACSKYFRAMFSGNHCESKKDKIEIGGVSAEALQLLVDFAYTSNVRPITIANVQPLLEAANMLQVGVVEAICEKFLEVSLSPDTCLGTWALADKVSCLKLSAMARSYALKKFEEVCATEEFLELPLNFLKMYISDEGLPVKKEEQLLDVIMLWAKHNLEERLRHLKELLECIWISRVDQQHLRNMMETDEVLAGVPGIMELIENPSIQARPRLIDQEEVLVLGGMTGRYGDMVHRHVYRLDLHGDCVSRTLLPPPLQRSSGSAACVVDNAVIVTGGDKSRFQAWRYQSSLNSWTRLASLVTPRSFHGMATLNGQVYVVGGVTSFQAELPLPVVEVYREGTNSWEVIAPLGQAVSNFGIAACCKKIYVFGGATGSIEETSSVQCYDPTQNVWTFKARMSKVVWGITVCTVKSKIYIVGGQLDSVLCYDPGNDCYEVMADCVAPWDQCSATMCGSEIFITGGRNKNDEDYYSRPIATVQCYNISSNFMMMGKDLPLPLYTHNTVTLVKH